MPITHGLTLQKWTLAVMEQNAMKRAPHPPYSPDLAPSDFYLFGYVKHPLSGSAFADADSLLQAVSDILECIEKVTLKGVFRNWMERLRRCSAMCREYVP
jgi:hypothetical protein